MKPNPPGMEPYELIPRIAGGLIGAAFAGIGLTTIGFLWGAPFGEFGSPPLFFRVFGSFIAFVFVVVGGSTVLAAFAGNSAALRRLAKRVHNTNMIDPPSIQTSTSSLNYACANCGAQLAKDADVSPLGDVKCPFCDRWFNIHRPKTNA